MVGTEVSEKTALLRELMERHGALMTGAALANALGYPTTGALKMARRRGQLTVPVFTIEHRRGHFALTSDVATWLINLRPSTKERHDVT